MRYTAPLIIALLLFVSPQAFAAPFENELHFDFRKYCEPVPPQPSPTPFASPEASPTPEPCEPEIPFDEQRDAYLFTDFTINEPVEIDLFIENPRLEMLTSMRAKLKYDPLKLDIVRLQTEESDFPLGAPGENDIDRENGTITIGRSLTGGSRSDGEFFVGRLEVMPYADAATLEFINYQSTELGDTAILFTSGVTSENRLTTPPKPLFFGQGATTGQQPTTSPQPGQPGASPPAIGGDVPQQSPDVQFPSDDGGFSRPQNLRVQTDEPGNVRLVWPIAPDPPVKGYYLYYGQKSGFYLRRRDVGRTNFAVFPDLGRGEKYFFAITAYDTNDNETDYSDEVFVTVGQPGSESHAFLGDPRSPEQPMGPVASPTPSFAPGYGMEDVDRTVDSGPEHILFFLVISLGFALFWYAFRRT